MNAAPAEIKATAGPLDAYNALRKAEELREDQAQYDVAVRLDRLASELGAGNGLSERGLFARLFGKAPSTAPRGLYLWGGVGRGKSMLMDLFFAHAPVTAKRRVHFHEFMFDVHARLRHERKTRSSTGKDDLHDPILPVAAALAKEARLLCFDEFHVTDVADAMILGRLFTQLLERGVVIVATSNRPPGDLYKDGLNRQLFLPFIAMIETAFDVLSLNGPTDYRLDRMRGMETWLTPVDARSTNLLSEAFFRLTDHDVEDSLAVPSDTLFVAGREIFVPKAFKGVAVFSFKRLCARPMGAADYLAIARRFHTVIIVAIPQMSPAMRNEAKRFTTLVDILYEHNVKLLASAAVAPEELYVEGTESFEFDRTVSRLLEMQSEHYLKRGHGA